MARKRRPQSSRARRPRASKSKASAISLSRAARRGKAKHERSHKNRYRAPRPSSLSESQLKVRAGAFGAHSEMMLDRNLSAGRAARENGVTIRDLRKYLPKAFKKDRSGRIRAVADRYLRRMEIPGPEGPVVIKVRGYKAKREVVRFRNDVFRFLGGERSALDKWKGVRIQGHELLTDPHVIRLLGEEDNLPEHFGSEQVIPYSGGAA